MMSRVTGESGMDDRDGLILELSALCGIIPEYWDIFGKKHEATIETRKGILKAMGMKVGSPEEIMREIGERKSRPWKNHAEPVQVASVNAQPLVIPLYIPIEQDRESDLTVEWYMANEEESQGRGERGAVARGAELTIDQVKWIDGVRYIRVLLRDTAQRELGYYTFHAEVRHPEKIFSGSSRILTVRSRIIVTPDACYLPSDLQRKKVWGLSMNLYALRSKSNWGVGDFTDLRSILKWLAWAGGSFAGVNPLHAIPNSAPFGVSPYSPLSRLYKNHIYVDIERVPEVSESPALRRFIFSPAVQSRIKDLRERTLIDYESVASLKEKILRKTFSIFYKNHFAGKTRRGKDFQTYIKEEGKELESFAVYSALRDYMRRVKNVHSWRDWPSELQDVRGKAVDEFRKSHARDIVYYQYVQWIIDRQLRDLSREARRLQMPIGLYFDMAVGSARGGSDAWSRRDVIAEGAEVGAPPDDFSPDGQNWGFPPFIPERLRETGYEPFIRTIQKNMKYGGAIRIDHALGLFRMFWIPSSMEPRDGAYVEQPFEALIRIIALESVRNRTLVIAEDLGTMSENVRKVLKRFRMLSYRLLYFERKYPDPAFLPPSKYPEMALCAVTTHDLPTLTGYWAGRDIDVRKKLGAGTPDKWRQLLDDRERDKKLILAALRRQRLLPADYRIEQNAPREISHDLCLAIYRYLSQTPCKLMLVSLDDVLGTLDQQNLPGTVFEHPNWIQKTPLMLEEMLKDERLSNLAVALKDRAW